MRERYPDKAIGELKLLPTGRRNRGGRHAITSFNLAFRHRAFVDLMPGLINSDGAEFDKRRIVLYAYRHSYAQRHADNGVGIEVLRELMGHRKRDTTKGYYSLGDNRRREAVDRVAALQFDRHGTRIWRQAQALLDSGHARHAIGKTVVPLGVCTEPSNVQAGERACPYRVRCAGCDHFRTDVSYLPDLNVYLHDLLRNRERLLAASDLDQWARAEATPSDEEVTRIRRLVSRISADLDDLSDADRIQIDQAVAAVRRHRSITLELDSVRAGSEVVGSLRRCGRFWRRTCPVLITSTASYPLSLAVAVLRLVRKAALPPTPPLEVAHVLVPSGETGEWP